MNARPDAKHLFVSTHLAKAYEHDLRETGRRGGGHGWLSVLVLVVLTVIALWALLNL